MDITLNGRGAKCGKIAVILKDFLKRKTQFCDLLDIV